MYRSCGEPGKGWNLRWYTVLFLVHSDEYNGIHLLIIGNYHLSVVILLPNDATRVPQLPLIIVKCR